MQVFLYDCFCFVFNGILCHGCGIWSSTRPGCCLWPVSWPAVVTTCITRRRIGGTTTSTSTSSTENNSEETNKKSWGNFRTIYIELLYLKYRLSASTNKTQPHCKKYFEKLNLNPHLVLATARSLSDSCEDRDTALGRANAPESRSLSLSRSLSRLLSCRPWLSPRAGLRPKLRRLSPSCMLFNKLYLQKRKLYGLMSGCEGNLWWWKC